MKGQISRKEKEIDMQKVIENAMLKITQAMEKNRKAYCEAKEWYQDTGQDRYWNKMERLDKEYEELKGFGGIAESEKKEREDAERTRLFVENKDLKRFIAGIKSDVCYIHADYWSDPRVVKLHEKLKEFNSVNRN